jgi:hypothetical protein
MACGIAEWEKTEILSDKLTKFDRDFLSQLRQWGITGWICDDENPFIIRLTCHYGDDTIFWKLNLMEMAKGLEGHKRSSEAKLDEEESAATRPTVKALRDVADYIEGLCLPEALVDNQ